MQQYHRSSAYNTLDQSTCTFGNQHSRSYYIDYTPTCSNGRLALVESTSLKSTLVLPSSHRDTAGRIEAQSNKCLGKYKLCKLDLIIDVYNNLNPPLS